MIARWERAYGPAAKNGPVNALRCFLRCITAANPALSTVHGCMDGFSPLTPSV